MHIQLLFQANFGLQDYEEAVADFKAVLEIEPSNKAAKNQLILCQQKLKQIKESEKKKYAGMFQKFADIDTKVLKIILARYFIHYTFCEV